MSFVEVEFFRIGNLEDLGRVISYYLDFCYFELFLRSLFFVGEELDRKGLIKRFESFKFRVLYFMR